jgi:hypothetical protein
MSESIAQFRVKNELLTRFCADQHECWDFITKTYRRWPIISVIFSAIIVAWFFYVVVAVVANAANHVF